MVNFEKIERTNRTWVVAHRGYRSKFPENTLSAFEAAVEAEADMIELDVCLTRDRIPVVIHDSTLDRTTNGKGSVSNYTYSELKKLDAGSWFSPEFKDEYIPTLEELMLKIRGRITINIEIKPECFETPQPLDAIEIKVCKLVEKLDMANSVLISSFQHSFFSRIELWYKKVGKSYLPRIAPLQANYLNDELVLELCKRHIAFSYHPHESFVTNSLINKIKAEGFKILPYTVNDEERMEHFINLGVTGIISDEPARLWEVIRSLKK